MLEGGPESVLRVSVHGASEGLENPFVGGVGVAHDLSGDISTLLIEGGLVEVGFE